MNYLGMPVDVPWVEVLELGSFYGPSNRDYRFRLFGTWASAPGPGPFWRCSKRGRSLLVVAVWYQEVRHTGTALWGETNWHPDHGLRATIHGLEQSHRAEDLKCIDRGLRLLRERLRNGGRPQGSGRLDRRFPDPNGLVAEYKCWAKDFVAETDKPPTQADFVDYLGSGSVDRLQAYFTDHGILWPPP